MPRKIVGTEATRLATLSLWRALATNASAAGSTVWENLARVFRTSCNPANLLDVAGFSSTGADGTAVIRLTEFICPGGLVFSDPVNVVATPRSSQPFFLTLDHAVSIGGPIPGTEVEITVRAWDASGSAAPGVGFDWRCRVPSFELIP